MPANGWYHLLVARYENLLCRKRMRSSIVVDFTRLRQAYSEVVPACEVRSGMQIGNVQQLSMMEVVRDCKHASFTFTETGSWVLYLCRCLAVPRLFNDSLCGERAGVPIVDFEISSLDKFIYGQRSLRRRSLQGFHWIIESHISMLEVKCLALESRTCGVFCCKNAMSTSYLCSPPPRTWTCFCGSYTRCTPCSRRKYAPQPCLLTLTQRRGMKPKDVTTTAVCMAH